MAIIRELGNIIIIPLLHSGILISSFYELISIFRVNKKKSFDDELNCREFFDEVDLMDLLLSFSSYYPMKEKKKINIFFRSGVNPIK